MEIQVLKPEQFKTTAWSGGVTREILIYPPGAEYGRRNFLYRVSTAIVESRESGFTDLPAYNRFIIPLNGELHLSIDQVRHIIEPLSVFHFDGGASTTSLSRQNLQDLNLMVLKNYPADVRIVKPSEWDELDLEFDHIIVRLKTDASGHFTEIKDAMYVPRGRVLSGPVLSEQELAVVMQLPDPAEGPMEEALD
ncbi:HutD family protein [Proteiniclasticum sp. QWL-01]|uniref:HutD family protein n=1 Tax=Proteiniclasticum sp. QWL-01 TaxID=3036945 RepID=UPI00240EA06E|nr:HutD family protein [Proteiniclasticum sp. QWL-01]WFF71734.1 HutD family protein [Proteiniclasticum sp. QWL-01]